MFNKEDQVKDSIFKAVDNPIWERLVEETDLRWIIWNRVGRFVRSTVIREVRNNVMDKLNVR